MKKITFLLLLFYSSVQAQSLQGVVTDAATGKPLVAVTVVNQVTQQAAYTNEHGVYSITSKPGDMIMFSYLGYKTVRQQKPPSVIVATLNIAMEQEAYQLREFKIMPGNLTPFQMDSIERRSIYRTELSRTHPSPIMSPVSAIAEKFSTKARRTYKFQKEYVQRDEQRFIDTRYTPELVNEQTGLEGDSIGHFMYAYPMAYNFARTVSDLELKMWIRYN